MTKKKHEELVEEKQTKWERFWFWVTILIIVAGMTLLGYVVGFTHGVERGREIERLIILGMETLR